MNVSGKRVVVFGLGASGRAAARLAVEAGAEVVAVDRRADVAPIPGAVLETGEHRPDTFASADLVVVSPGIPADVPPLRAAVAAGVPVLGEIHFALEICHTQNVDLPIVAISGTNGKSTVTHFTGQILEHAGMRPFAGGNLGRPLSEAAFAESRGRFGALVVEVSSYQMEWPSPRFKPKASVILNLTPDHLARHGDMDAYGAMKCRMFTQTTPDDVVILPHPEPGGAEGADRLWRLAEGVGRGTRLSLGALPGVARQGTSVRFAIGQTDGYFDLTGLRVPGEHNKDNAATAALLALAVGAPHDKVQAGLTRLTALPHRMEEVSVVGGVTWVNDSKATNVAATLVGVSGLDRGGVLLLGGQAKGDRFADLAPHLGRWRVVTFGGSGPAIADELEGCGVPCLRAGGLADGVAKARTIAKPGDIALLSPGCASFDEFRNFEHRGDEFARIVRSFDDSRESP